MSKTTVSFYLSRISRLQTITISLKIQLSHSSAPHSGFDTLQLRYNTAMILYSSAAPAEVQFGTLTTELQFYSVTVPFSVIPHSGFLFQKKRFQAMTRVCLFLSSNFQIRISVANYWSCKVSWLETIVSVEYCILTITVSLLEQLSHSSILDSGSLFLKSFKNR